MVKVVDSAVRTRVARLVRRSCRVAAPILAVLAARGLWSLIPRPFLPAPTGSYLIGTTVAEVVDVSRRELFAPGARPRTLPTQIWYPAAAPSDRPEPYVRDPHVFDGILDLVHLPRALARLWGRLPSHATVDAPVAPGRFPVVVISQGNLGYRQSQSVQVEELVSHGFIVVSLDQPGVIGSALLSDGTRIPYRGGSVLKPLIDQSIEPQREAPRLDGTPFPVGLASYLAADPRAVLDWLGTESNPLRASMDLDRVGAMGMSLGGYTSAQWCTTDLRVKACLIMDAPMTIDAVAKGFSVPTLWLTRPASDMAAEGWPPVEVRHNYGTQRAAYQGAKAPAWFVTVSGLFHADLTDAPYGAPGLSLVGMTSKNAGSEVHEIVRRISVDFFDRALRGATRASSLDAPPSPRVRVESRH